MRKKLALMMDRWGHYALALLCAGVIALSALWTGAQQRQEASNTPALLDESQRLQDVTPSPGKPQWTRPAAGQAVCGYSDQPVLFPDTGVWKIHRAVDFEAGSGEPVFAMAAGTARIEGEELRIDHGEGWQSRYRGLAVISVRDGQQVRAGEKVGQAGGRVPYEGENRVCVSLFAGNEPVPFGEDWLTYR